eukprot:maker-scaffold915_size81523-snap-gene-0.11 protein:Tk11470 transcript:maker-scaffold915_size81523-snap-gene-0.11-mRNA-1 annotation:"amidohydrolase"
MRSLRALAADYDCSKRAYKGMCYDCPYNNLRCQRAGPSVIYKNGVIYTADKDGDPNWHEDPKEAMVVQNGKIAFVGSNAEAMGFNVPGTTRVVDLAWKTVLPGFHDTHMHPLESRHKAAGTCMLTKDTKPEDQLQVFRDYCFDNQKGTNWTLGWGHSVWTLLDYVERTGKDPKKLLDPLIVDAAGNPIPAILMEFTSHSVWVNSKALELAGITKNTKNEKGSVYMRNPVTNEPNGIVLENAGNKMFEEALDPNLYPALRQMNKDAAKSALHELAKNGLTSVVDARSYWKREHDQAWEQVEQEGKLTTKLVLSMWAYPGMEDDEQIAKLKTFFKRDASKRLKKSQIKREHDKAWEQVEQEGKLTTKLVLSMWAYPGMENDEQIAKLKAFFKRDASKRLKKSQIKVYMDGILPTRTNKLLQPYIKDAPDYGIGNVGMNYFTQARLTKYLKALQNIDGQEGYDFIIHQVGDGAGTEALNAIRDSLDDAVKVPRHKLTHVELLNAQDIPRFAQLGVIADAQVAGSFAMPHSSGHKELEEYIGKERAKNSIPVKSLVDSGALVTLSTDWDVSELNPFNSLANALQREHQSIDLKTAMELYTINGAYSMRQEGLTGSLVAGKDADFVIIDKDIFQLEADGNPNAIRTTKVLATILEVSSATISVDQAKIVKLLIWPRTMSIETWTGKATKDVLSATLAHFMARSDLNTVIPELEATPPTTEMMDPYDPVLSTPPIVTQVLAPIAAPSEELDSGPDQGHVKGKLCRSMWRDTECPEANGTCSFVHLSRCWDVRCRPPKEATAPLKKNDFVNRQLWSPSDPMDMSTEIERMDSIHLQMAMATNMSKSVVIAGDINLDLHRIKDTSYTKRSLLLKHL